MREAAPWIDIFAFCIISVRIIPKLVSGLSYFVSMPTHSYLIGRETECVVFSSLRTWAVIAFGGSWEREFIRKRRSSSPRSCTRNAVQRGKMKLEMRSCSPHAYICFRMLICASVYYSMEQRLLSLLSSLVLYSYIYVNAIGNESTDSIRISACSRVSVQ